MICCFLSLALAAVGPGEDEVHQTIAVYTAPPAIVFALAGSAAQHVAPLVYLPLGINFGFGAIEWSIDAAVVSLPTRNLLFASHPGYHGLWISGGPVVHSGHDPLGGMFFTPKLTVGAFIVDTGTAIFDVLIGGEGGYQFTYGHLYCAIVLGASVGIGIGENDGIAGPWLNIQQFRAQPVREVFGVNFDLFRVGYDF